MYVIMWNGTCAVVVIDKKGIGGSRNPCVNHAKNEREFLVVVHICRSMRYDILCLSAARLLDAVGIIWIWAVP